MEKYLVPDHITPQLAKDYLRRHLGISGSLWKKIKQENQFYVNGVQVLATRVEVKPGDEISFSYPISSQVIPVAMDLDVVFEDPYFLILNKPAPQLTHPLSHEQDTALANGVMAYYQAHNIVAGCHPIYRLDRNTSGLVAFAKLPQIQAWLGGNHEKLQRYYYALVTGHLPHQQGTINAPLGPAENSIVVQTVREDGKEAITHYEVLEEFSDYSLLKLRLDTGRTHQIRAHLAYLNHPLLGDDLYGGAKTLIQRQALHAGTLQFQHPFTKEAITLSTPLPTDMAQLVNSTEFGMPNN